MYSCSQESLLRIFHNTFPHSQSLSCVECPQDSDSEVKICMLKVYWGLSLRSTPVREWKNQGSTKREGLWDSQVKASSPHRELGWPLEFSYLVQCSLLSKGPWTWVSPEKWHELLESVFLRGQFPEGDFAVGWVLSHEGKGLTVSPRSHSGPPHCSICYRFGLPLSKPHSESYKFF